MTFVNKYLKSILALSLALMMLFALPACVKVDPGIADDTKSEASQDETEPVSVTAAVSETAAPASAANPKYTVGVILYGDSEEYMAAYDGFVKAFDERDFEQNGFHHNIILTQCANKKECKSAAAEYADMKVDLIYAIGETAAVAAANATDEIPIIFSCVADPLDAKLLTSLANPDKNVTGVSDFTPAEKQIDLIKTILPDAKKIGALYCSTDANSTLVSDLAKTQAEALGVEYTTYAAPNDTKLKNTLENALEESDVLYLCEDELTKEQADMIITAANKKKIPVISATDTFMSKGAFATALPDYADIGYNAGELALICVKGISPINEIAVEYPALCINYVSKSAVKKLSLELSDTAADLDIQYVD